MPTTYLNNLYKMYGLLNFLYLFQNLRLTLYWTSAFSLLIIWVSRFIKWNVYYQVCNWATWRRMSWQSTCCFHAFVVLYLCLSSSTENILGCVHSRSDPFSWLDFGCIRVACRSLLIYLKVGPRGKCRRARVLLGMIM